MGLLDFGLVDGFLDVYLQLSLKYVLTVLNLRGSY